MYLHLCLRVSLVTDLSSWNLRVLHRCKRNVVDVSNVKVRVTIILLQKLCFMQILKTAEQIFSKRCYAAWKCANVAINKAEKQHSTRYMLWTSHSCVTMYRKNRSILRSLRKQFCRTL